MRLEQDIAADDRAAKETILASHPKTILMMGTERAAGRETGCAYFGVDNNHAS